ncbi:MAG TPA: YkgJ family cysteine cluster protein [Sphingomicrobium sp.]|nr:YkgJ family cysteine cluster protein [Sphingomicrobium sp.]
MPDTPIELQPAKTGTTTARETPSIGSQLCTKCGLCCTGALHDRAVLEPEELEFARDLGLEVQTEGRLAFALPCKYLQGCSCSIYSNRPKVCARYQCQLLDDVQQANVSLDAALEHVRVAKRMCDDVRALLPPGMNFPQARRLLHEPPSAEAAAGRSAEMRLRLALTTLCLYLDKHFKHSKESKLLTMTSVDQDMESTEA